MTVERFPQPLTQIGQLPATSGCHRTSGYSGHVGEYHARRQPPAASTPFACSACGASWRVRLTMRVVAGKAAGMWCADCLPADATPTVQPEAVEQTPMLPRPRVGRRTNLERAALAAADNSRGFQSS